MDQSTLQNLAKFFSETAMLKRTTRTGTTLAGVTKPDYLGNHIARTAQIAYILAFLENANPEKTATLVLFHDYSEIRVGDQTKVGSRYYDKSQIEENALIEQLQFLPEKLAQTIKSDQDCFEDRSTKEAIIAKDADWLEMALSAKELVEQGYLGMQNWIDNVSQALETPSAQDILDYIKTMDDFTNCWWQDLKKMTYQKLKK